MFSRPEHVVEYFKNKLDIEGEALGIKFVGAYDEKLIPKYPAVVVSPGTVEKTLHGTHTFLLTFRVFFWVYHGDLTATHRQRSVEDLEFATGVVAAIESDMGLSGNIIQGWVEAETPGIVQPKSNKGSAIVGTRLNWQGWSEARF